MNIPFIYRFKDRGQIDFIRTGTVPVVVPEEIVVPLSFTPQAVYCYLTVSGEWHCGGRGGREEVSSVGHDIGVNEVIFYVRLAADQGILYWLAY